MPGQKVLLVEGQDDKHVLLHICQHHDIPRPVEVVACGGDDKLLENIQIRSIALSNEGDVLGAVIDADTNLENRWQSVRERLADAGYQDVPFQPNPCGTILQPPSGTILPKAGIWIMPDNQTTGILEDFLQFLVPSPDDLMNHANDCVESISDPLFRPIDRPKAIMHTWLAWQENPGRPFGTAITSRFLDPGASQVEVLVDWLRQLFSEPS